MKMVMEMMLVMVMVTVLVIAVTVLVMRVRVTALGTKRGEMKWGGRGEGRWCTRESTDSCQQGCA